MFIPQSPLISLTRFSCVVTFLLLYTLISAASSYAQDDDVIKVESSLIQLNVGVADQKGRAITDLTVNDFIVYEDDVKQKITSFEPTIAPFSLALLLDVSGSTQSFRQTIKLAAARFIDALAPNDRVAVLAFNKQVETLTDFTTDRKKIAWAIQSAEGKGDTALYKAIRQAMKLLSKEKSRRKAIVVLTDGLDTEMRDSDRKSIGNAETDETAIAAINPEVSKPFTEIITEADRQGVTIYPLVLPSGDVKKLPILTPTIVGIYHAARVRIQALANRTGGRLNEIRRLEEMGRLYAEVAADLRTLYTISYQASSKQKRDNRWRNIRIEVNRPDLIARTKPGYYAH
jgi:VWFA-related protein